MCVNRELFPHDSPVVSQRRPQGFTLTPVPKPPAATPCSSNDGCHLGSSGIVASGKSEPAYKFSFGGNPASSSSSSSMSSAPPAAFAFGGVIATKVSGDSKTKKPPSISFCSKPVPSPAFAPPTAFAFGGVTVPVGGFDFTFRKPPPASATGNEFADDASMSDASDVSL